MYSLIEKFLSFCGRASSSTPPPSLPAAHPRISSVKLLSLHNAVVKVKVFNLFKAWKSSSLIGA